MAISLIVAPVVALIAAGMMPAAACWQSCSVCRRRHRAVRGDADRANADILAVQYQGLMNPVSGAVAVGTLLAAATLPVVVCGWWREVAPRRQKLSCWVYGARHDQSKASILTLA
ncbi:hypothetical protein [Bradyrhizobium frederickii]|uniref:hypothetical protein n=1 Tax=Bradyrhizobium frederickii TaxID=2560054 RepID=UPI001F365923|nr:hypothetical protein [Bradyrhizobium frederickii]